MEDNEKRMVSLKLTVLARQLDKQFNRSVEALGISNAKWRLIAVVARRPGATQRLIAELLEISEVTAGRLIDRLCLDGFLERRESTADRRAFSVYLTEKAQPVLRRLGELASEAEDVIFEGLSGQDMRTLRSLLDTVYDNLARAREKPAMLQNWGPVPDLRPVADLPQEELSDLGIQAGRVRTG